LHGNSGRHPVKPNAAIKSDKREAAIEIRDKILYRFKTNCDAQQAFANASRGPGFRGNAAMRGRGRVSNGGFGIAKIGGN
jgi:hypothetical protein